MEQKGRESSLMLLTQHRNLLMGVAALWILVFHEWQMVTAEGSAVYQAEYFIKRIGFCGVDIFFLLSGLGMVYALEKNSLPGFYFNRLKRIVIPFLTMAIVMALVDHWTMSHFFRCISGVAFYTESIYSILWFVPAVITLYLLVPLYFAIFRRSKNKAFFTIGAISVWLLISMLLRDTMREDLYGFTNRIPIFLVGILFGWWCKHTGAILGKRAWIGFTCILVLGIYLAWQTNINYMEILVPISNCCIPNFLIAISLSYLLAKGFDLLSKCRGTRWLSIGINGIFGFYGMISLEFYCVQEWIAGKILGDLVERWGALCANGILLLIVTACGFLLWMFNKGVVWCINRIVQAVSGKKNEVEGKI